LHITFQVKERLLKQSFNITEMETEVKVLGLAKTLTEFLKIQLQEEDFNPTIGDNDLV
jgi:hypothetical protein